MRSRPGSAGICVVGAGPAGVVLALRLGQDAIPCTVFERLTPEVMRRKAGAGLIEYRTFQRLDSHALADVIAANGARNGTCEFRAEGRSFELDYGAVTGGRVHYIYAQHELVAALAEQLRAAGGAVRYGTRVTSVEPGDGCVTVRGVEEASGQPVAVECRFVVLCDGARSAFLDAVGGASVFELQHPFRWLTLIADTAPSKPRTIYGLHPRGFAGQMRRGPHLTRYMLEVPRGDTLEQWPDDRIWAELQERLRAQGEPELAEGPLLERDVLDLRVRVIEPMQAPGVFLAGDAAHLITPAGGKGMNLAIQDALELADGLHSACGGDDGRLQRYSSARLPAIWRTQEFSNWMLSLLHAGRPPVAGPGEADRFAYRLRRARLHELINNPRLTRWFAHAYAGVDD